jgi:hypothetical protein
LHWLQGKVLKCKKQIAHSGLCEISWRLLVFVLYLCIKSHWLQVKLLVFAAHAMQVKSLHVRHLCKNCPGCCWWGLCCSQ